MRSDILRHLDYVVLALVVSIVTHLWSGLVKLGRESRKNNIRSLQAAPLRGNEGSAMSHGSDQSMATPVHRRRHPSKCKILVGKILLRRWSRKGQARGAERRLVLEER